MKAIKVIYNNRYEEGILGVNKCTGGRYYIHGADNHAKTNVQIWHNGVMVCNRDYTPNSTPLSGSF